MRLIMKKIFKYLVPLLGLIVLMAGCNKRPSFGEKKTVSEVDQLLTKKGQQFEADDYVKFTVTSPNHLSVKDTVNGSTNNIVLKPSGTTADKKYAIYDIESTGSGSYKFLNNRKAIIAKVATKKKQLLEIYADKESNLTTKNFERLLKKPGGLKLIIKD